MLALADRRNDEQVDADEEIERFSRDEPDDLIRKLQDAIGACGTFFDAWYQRNNLPSPPNPGAIAMELMGRDLVHERTMRIVSSQVVIARRSRRATLSVLASESQLPLL